MQTRLGYESLFMLVFFMVKFAFLKELGERGLGGGRDRDISVKQDHRKVGRAGPWEVGC